MQHLWKKWIERLIVLYKLVIFMREGWSDWRETYSKYYFDTSFCSWLKFYIWKRDLTGNLQVDIVIGIILDTLYISVYDLLFLNINTVNLVMLVFINQYFTLSTQYCIWISMSLWLNLSVFLLKNSRYKDIYLCLLDIICIFAMISYWTLSLIQISNVGY